VLAILITAPLGAILVTVLGPRLLQKEDAPATETNTPPENQTTEDVTLYQTADFL
jgi:hypothetical protein